MDMHKEEAIRDAFAYFDVHGDGRMPRERLVPALQSLGALMSTAQTTAALRLRPWRQCTSTLPPSVARARATKSSSGPSSGPRRWPALSFSTRSQCSTPESFGVSTRDST